MKIKVTGVLSHILWSIFQRGGGLLIAFVANMILSRLLTPEEFGGIGLVLIVVSMADLLVDSGLGAALIQKTNIDKKDISTVFTTNFIISVALYIIIFFLSPFFERYFSVEHLSLFLRVVSISILIRAFTVVESSLLQKQLRFKAMSIISVSTAAVSSIVGIAMAACGFGIWSLVLRNLIQHFVSAVLYRRSSRVPYKLGFDKESFRQLFGFGWFSALTSFMDLIYTNTLSSIIGKRYSVSDLGYYNQANSLQQVPTYSLSMVVNQVLFPHMSKIHENKEQVRSYARRSFIVSSFVSFPLLMFLLCFAKPIIILLYSAKWEPSVIFFQILCAGGVLNTLVHICRCILKSMGNTKLLFNVQLIMLLMGVGMFLFVRRFDMRIMVCTLVFNTIINWLILAIIVGKRLNYPFLYQLKDVLSPFVISLCGLAASQIVVILFSFNNFLSLLVAACVFFTLYIGIHALFKTKAFIMCYNMCFQHTSIRH